MSGSFRVYWIMHIVLAEMSIHVLIGRGFITSLLDGIHVILGHSLYSSGSYGVRLLVHIVLIEMVSHVIFLGFIMFLLDVILRPTPLVSEIIWSLLVCVDSPYREDEPCYDILFYFFMFILNVMLGHTP